MNDGEFRGWMDYLGNQVRVLQLVPVGELLEVVVRAQTLAPMLEPTAYMRGGADNLRDQEDVLRAVDGLLAAVDRIKARHPELALEIPEGTP